MTFGNMVSSVKDGSFWHKLYVYLFFTKKLYWVYAFFVPRKVNPRKIVMCNFGGCGYGCNPKYLAEYICKNRLEYEIVWLVDSRKFRVVSEFPKQIRVVELYSARAVRELVSAGIWIDNHRKGWFPKKKTSQLYIQTWHGGFACKKIEQDAPRLPETYVRKAKRDSTAIDVIISDCPVNSAIFKNGFWYSGEVLECGIPRTDIFFDMGAVASAMAKIRKAYAIFGSKKVALYAPTFRQSLTLEPYKLDYTQIQQTLVQKFGGEWQLCVRLHPNLSANSAHLKIPATVVDMSDWADMQEILCAADVLITDYSGIMFDYWFLNRPTFLFATDFADYTKNDREFYVPIETLPFSLAKSNDELVNNIKNFDESSYLKTLSDFKDEYKVVSDGHACQKVIEWLENKRSAMGNGNV